MANFFQVGVILGVSASVAWVSWPAWKSNVSLPAMPAWTQQLPGTVATPEAEPATLYRWTDSQGVVHFSQEAEAAKAKVVQVDTGKITPMAAVDVGSLEAPAKGSAVSSLRQNIQQAQEQQLQQRMQGSGIE